MKITKSLLENIDNGFLTTTINNYHLEKIKSLITDQSYIDFLVKEANGGFFFNRSLQIY
jgi:hypothetical protein